MGDSDNETCTFRHAERETITDIFSGSALISRFYTLALLHLSSHSHQMASQRQKWTTNVRIYIEFMGH